MTLEQPNPESGRQALTADFVSGFFAFLQNEGYAGALLHGWEEGFERELSDVDFVVDPRGFSRVAELIHGYCRQQRWQLCQVLRHEETAAYCVCSRIGDPSCVVALDACSDYQRNGVVLLTAAELLEGTLPLPGGGARVSDAAGIKYRFAKAAAKGKPVADLERELSMAAPSALAECRSWLKERYGIVWDEAANRKVGDALSKLRSQTRPRPPLAKIGSLTRIAKRLMEPAGLVLVLGERDFSESSEPYLAAFGRLYFRKVRVAPHWRSGMLLSVIRSSLVIVPGLPSFWRRLIPAACVYAPEASATSRSGLVTLAGVLHLRCALREKLS